MGPHHLLWMRSKHPLDHTSDTLSLCLQEAAFPVALWTETMGFLTMLYHYHHIHITAKHLTSAQARSLASENIEHTTSGGIHLELPTINHISRTKEKSWREEWHVANLS